VMMIDHGKLLFNGALETLQERFGGNRRLIVDFDVAPQSLELPGVRVIEQDGVRFSLEFERHVRVSELIRLLSERHAIRDLSVVEPDIEATIRRIYEGDLLNQT
jgi:ABC-2 type transport system ATP-binding protein